MKTVREVMTREIITVHPSSTVKTAVILLKGHEIGVLPVVNGEALLGVVDVHDILGQDESLKVADVMSGDYVSISPDMTISKAAETMSRTGQNRLLVEEEARLVGLVTPRDLLPDLGRLHDPVTGLPWSDTLREWSMEVLASGSEISLLFFDIDDFGLFNKRYGHITGDMVLKSVASVLHEAVHPETDLLCRMGGDEFVIGSIRRSDESRRLGELIAERVARMQVEDVEEQIGISFGASGGRRTRERETVHYAATLDNLLNRASRECTKMKKEKKGPGGEDAASASDAPGVQDAAAPGGQEVAAGALEPRLKIDQVRYSSSDIEQQVEIRLALGGVSFEHGRKGFPGAASLARLAADTCACAIQQALPEGWRVAVDDVRQLVTPGAETLIVSTVVVACGREIVTCHGIAPVRRGDLHRAAAASVLSATNRVIARALAE